MEKEDVQTVQGWKDVNVTLDMPLGAFLSFINALNQRLVQLEDVTKVPNGSKMISLTELYSIQAAEAQEARMKAAEHDAEPVDNNEDNEEQGA